MKRLKMWEINFFLSVALIPLALVGHIVFGDQEKSSISPAIVANKEIIWTQEMENERLAQLMALKEVKKVSPSVKKIIDSGKVDAYKPTVKPVVVEKKIQVTDTNVAHTKISLTDKIQVVACLNEKNMTIHAVKNGNCYLGQGGKWKNILLPPKSHIEQFKKIFGEDYKYRLAIANFEGSFNENASNPYAIGYLQTLRTHKVKKDIVSQLTWLKNREIGTTGRICDLNKNAPYGGSTKLDRFTCMARGHYGFHRKGDKHYAHGIMYGKRYKAATEYYLSIDF